MSRRRRPTLDRGQSSDNLSSSAATAAATKRGAAASRKESKGQLAPSSVQEELKRLINPDISFTDDRVSLRRFAGAYAGCRLIRVVMRSACK